MKRLLIAAAAALMIASSANAYEGNWYYDNNPGGFEVLALGDNTDGTYRFLRGTARWCGRRGVSYATMRGVLRRNGLNGEQIRWWEDYVCTDGYVRVCVENLWGEQACSTYWDEGWRH